MPEEAGYLYQQQPNVGHVTLRRGAFIEWASASESMASGFSVCLTMWTYFLLEQLEGLAELIDIVSGLSLIRQACTIVFEIHLS